MSRYLSRLCLNPLFAPALKVAADPYELHRKLLDTLPCGPKSKPATAFQPKTTDLLFRVDDTDAGPVVLVQTNTKPDWDALELAPRALRWPPETKEYAPNCAAGQRLGFRLLCQPVVRQSGQFGLKANGKPMPGPRRACRDDAQRLDWLRRKAGECGFAVETVGVTLLQWRNTKPLQMMGGNPSESHEQARKRPSVLVPLNVLAPSVSTASSPSPTSICSTQPWPQAWGPKKPSVSACSPWPRWRDNPCERYTNCPAFTTAGATSTSNAAVLDQEASGLVFHTADAHSPVPIDQLSLVMLGPGTTISHAAVKALAANNCLLAWVGEDGVRLYAHSTGGTFSARRLLLQARLFSDEPSRLAVAYRMYQKRFPGTPLEGQEHRAGARHGGPARTARPTRRSPPSTASSGRAGTTTRTTGTRPRPPTGPSPPPTPASTAFATRPSCRPAIPRRIGFVHTGKILSFVYDVADLYKTETTVPVAFRLAAAVTTNLERAVRMECRQVFHAAKLMERILPDIAEVLNAGDDPGETAEEMEGALSRWLIEVRPGMFLGNPSQRIRDELWRQITRTVAAGLPAPVVEGPLSAGVRLSPVRR